MRKLLIAFAVMMLVVAGLSLAAALMWKGHGIPVGSKVALVRIEGPIYESREVVKQIDDYTEDGSIKVIVLRIDSPGGAVAPSQEIHAQVLKALEKKKVVVSMGALAASGGYYIAAPATRIVANPGTLTGSIGVIMEIPDISGLMDKVGVKSQVIKSGKNKDLASIFREIDPEAREILQGVINDIHDQFVRDVARDRKMRIEKVVELADGRVYTGRQALEIGLVDELGGLEDAIKIAGEMAGIKGKPEVVEYMEEPSLMGLLKEQISTGLGRIVPPVAVKFQYVP